MKIYIVIRRKINEDKIVKIFEKENEAHEYANKLFFGRVEEYNLIKTGDIK